MVLLMDRLLKQENLDLHLTPYRVLATAQDEGMVEFVPSTSLAQVESRTEGFVAVVVWICITCPHAYRRCDQVLAEHKTIVNYFQQFHPDEDGPFGISSSCLETFVKSCAGYCVIMYILGVGDRCVKTL